MERQDLIKKRGSKFVVTSMSGKPLGEFDSPEEAKERLREIEAAKAAKGDSIETVRRVDYLGEVHFDPQRVDGALAKFTAEGFLRVDARLTRVGVFTYGDADGNTWGELRTEDEVFDAEAMRSFEMVVLTDDHPPEFVDASNVKEVQVGHVGTDVHKDGDFLSASIVVTDPNVIRSIADGKVELSCGYTAQVIKEDGVTQAGVPFTARQTGIRGNHVALVTKGRAGPQCRLLTERGDALTIMEDTMETQDQLAMATVVVDGVEHPVPVAVAEAFTKLNADTSDEDADEDKEETEMENTNDEATALRARVDALEAELTTTRDREAARIDARVNLVTTTREILGSGHKTDGENDAALMRAVVLHVNPGLKDRLDANAGDGGYLRASYEAAVDLHRSRADVADEIPTALFDAMGTEERNDLDAEHRAYINRITGRGTRTEA
jgi:hypothetical protein